MHTLPLCRQWLLLNLMLLSVAYSTSITQQPASHSIQRRSLTNTTTRTVVTSTSTSTDYETLATILLNNAAKRMQLIWNRKREIFLNLTKGRGYSIINQAPIKQEIDNDYRRLVYDLAGNLSVIPVDQLKSDTLRRQVPRLGKLQLHGLETADYEEAKEKLHTMQTFMTMRLVCHYNHAEDCTQTVPIQPNIMVSVTKSKHYNEIEYYWLKWRQALGERDLAKSTFIDFVRLLRIAATYNGHVTPSRTWYLYYETNNFQRELENVVLEMMPLYREMHAYLRHSVRQTYGNHITEADGAIPHPVLEQLIQQAWYARNIFRVPYPKSHLPQVQPRLEETLVTPVKINNVAAEFFESLGLNHMSDAFYEKYSRRMSDEEAGAECKSEVFYFPPDVALRYCPKLDYKKLMQRHGHMAELQYNLYKKELPFGLDREPCPGFGNAIGETAVIASGTPRHLHRLHILDNYTLTAEQSMNRLFRMGVHTILAIPQYFVNEKFLVDVMDGRIGSHEYNCGYWRLQYKYAGVVPPVKRSEKHFDPDFKFYRGMNPEKPNTAKFIAEVLGHQFYRAVCLASGQYRAGDPDYPLHNCDFYGSAEAGKLIRSMMQLGATKHWRDIMELATGERELTAKGVLEYFAPLYTWLKEQNRQLGLEPGWDADIKCSSD